MTRIEAPSICAQRVRIAVVAADNDRLPHAVLHMLSWCVNSIRTVVCE